MWKRYIIPIAAISIGFSASMVSYANQKQLYNPQEFRSVLRGLGYNVKVINTPIIDEETKKAILKFQIGYKIKPADGLANQQTQSFAANLVTSLRKNLNIVVKPNPPLPENQYYDNRIGQAVQEFQKKYQLQQTGIADLGLRQKLAQEAKSIQSNQSPESTLTPSQ